MNLVRLSWLSGILGYRALFSWNTPGLFFSVLILTPLLQMCFFVLVGRGFEYQNDLFFVLGSPMVGATAASIGGLVSVVAEERRFQTLGVILESPASRVAVFVGRVLPGVCLSFLLGVVISGIGLAFLGFPLAWSLWGLYLCALSVSAVSGAALGLALSATGLIVRDIYQLADAAQLALLLTSGAVIRIEHLPGVLRVLGGLLPLQNAVSAVRGLIADGFSEEVGIFLLREFAIGLVWGAIAIILLRVLESQARRLGTHNFY